MRNFIFNNKVVVLHTSDLDSIAGAWAFLDCNNIAGKIYFQLIDTFNVLPPGLENCSVILCGFTLANEVMHELVNKAHFVFVLDNNMESLQPVLSLSQGFKNVSYVIDICWDFLHSSPLPTKVYSLVSGHSLGCSNIFEFGRLVETVKDEDMLINEMSAMKLN